jgi:hypothetical protein
VSIEYVFYSFLSSSKFVQMMLLGLDGVQISIYSPLIQHCCCKCSPDMLVCIDVVGLVLLYVQSKLVLSKE